MILEMTPSLRIVQTLRTKSSIEAARLIGCAPQYITDNNLVNLLNMYDLNNKTDKQKDRRLEQQFDMFASNPGLKDQVDRWLSS